MFSKSCKYGIRAVLYLAQHTDGDHKVGVKQIATSLDVPLHFIAKILQELSRKRIISSVKGPNGGFFLTDKNKEQNLLSVVQMIDGLSWYEDCAFGLRECSNARPCPIHHIFQPLKNQLYADLSTQSIRDFAENLESGYIHIGNA